MKLFSYKKIILGDFVANQYTLIEHKGFFSVILYYFKGDGWQDRFHSHAFHAVSFKIFGTYNERKLLDSSSGQYSERTRKSFIKFFPKSSFHMLGKSNGCLTILFSGPWEKTWKEYKDGKEVELNWNRVRKNIE